MATQIGRKIVGYEVVTPEKKAQTPEAAPKAQEVLRQRGEVLSGVTYKIKPPTQEQALYITINDAVDETGRTVPFEVFMNSKNMESFQWIVSLTRLISAVFRKGGDVTFLVEELKSVHDPRGGYFLKGKLYPSVVAHIGSIIEQHLAGLGILDLRMDAARAKIIAEKVAKYGANAPVEENGSVPLGEWCSRCQEHSVIKLDGCPTCTRCGDSKCG